MITNTTAPLADLEQALIDTELTAAKKLGKKAPETKAAWSTDRMTNKITWTMLGLAELSVSVIGFSLGKSVQEGGMLYAPVYAQGEPDQITLVLKYKLLGASRVFHSQFGQPKEYTGKDLPPLGVKVDWQVPVGGRHMARVPHTRVKNMDNVDVVFMTEDGSFVQVQIGLVTRSGGFWVTVQQIHADQVVTTNELLAINMGWPHVKTESRLIAIAAPLLPQHCTPPNKYYLEVFPNMGPELIRLAAEARCCVARSEMIVPEWSPVQIKGDLPAKICGKSSWVKATVNYFNLIVGSGTASLADGTVIQVHHTRILDSQSGQPLHFTGRFGTLQAMTEVAVRLDHEGEVPRAASIVVMPLESKDIGI
ncbi:MAG: hypothetical protein V4481_02535 [Patescibacteria group bacterium]